MALLHLFVQYTICIIFLLSLSGKVLNFWAFVDVVRAFKLVAPGIVPTVAVLAGLAEVFVLAATATVAGPLALLPALMLLLVYSAVLALVRIRGINVGCNCFGGSGEAVSWVEVARNGLLALLVLAAIATGPGYTSGNLLQQHAVAAAIAVCASAIIVNLREIHTLVFSPYLGAKIK